MPYNYSDERRMNSFHRDTVILKSDFGIKLRTSESVNDVATFVYKFGQERFIEFLWYMRDYLPSCNPNAKSNVTRIA